ncbi:MAG: Type I Iterative PKS [Watsoniomyces obsoletus]|nr:MAG: Type I Iterative PKS [Watsoniomyces obsoletus]
MAQPSLVVFGPQTTWPTAEYLFQLRAVLLLDPRLHSFLFAIKGLAEFWQDLVKHDPALKVVSGGKYMDDLREWIDHGEFPPKSGVPPNVLTMPFTIIIHLVQYFHYMDQDVSQAQLLEGLKVGGVQGFCTGILTALAVGCSKTEEGVNTYGAVALRLALCIGAYVDLDGISSDGALESASLAVRWRSAAGHELIMEILKNYPNAYISVIRDSTDVNITSPKTVVAALSQQLTAQEMAVKSTGLEGRYHTTANKEALEKISGFCASRSDMAFPDANQLLVPVRSNIDAQIITNGSLVQHALQCILVDLSNWHLTITAAASQLIHMKGQLVVSFGLIESIPSSVVRESELRVIKMKGSKLFPSKLMGSDTPPSAGIATPALSAYQDGPYPGHAVAVVGMACKFPGAESLDEFWQLLTAGTSMCQEMPLERFSTQGLRRSPDGKLRFFGNFVRDPDVFDHRFFKKSSREAASMDPQQRMLLQVAYQAMESSGYFGTSSGSSPNDIGCYLGVCATDYNDNVASHPPNAFSSLGTLRAFLSGKISHFFGWTGPSVTYDTACSSSAVAIHAACRAIATGECSQAVAGGSSLYTSPYFYQNLAAASFLSPTGPTKPFDAKADGYCRGEGVGLVVLKRLSAAIDNGDNILGVIAGSAVNQNSNATYITVPHSPSQVELYQKVSSMAGIDTAEVSFVEAHGTGTPVGDPIEFESIRQVFGGARRTKSLHVTSVKGNIGHLEGASGVASLIKTLLMMQHHTIPVQANYSKLNPKIPALEPDRMVIPVETKKWDAEFQIACINNYGAAGSNAAMIVCSGPPASGLHERQPLAKYPIFISANSSASLSAYCGALQKQLSSNFEANLLADLAFNLAVKQNRTFSHVFTSTVSSLDELREQLSAGASGSGNIQVDASPKAVVLVFGGQVSNTIGLSKDIYDASTLLRSHLDHCDTVLQSLGLGGLYPDIFQTSPVEDVVKLHSMLFSLQYSCAQAWMDAGLKVDALAGHSFGQLTALSVSGTLSLKDGLKLVSGRASLMKEHWGPERGSMISLEADINTVLNLIHSIDTSGTGHSVEIACYNGPTSHVLVGTESSIQALQERLPNFASSTGPIKFKKLNVTHGFHSVFTEPLLPGLLKLAERLTFNEPTIPLETCSNNQAWTRPTPQLIVEHTRTPVYFGQAIDRLARRLGSCTWLEAGSSSSVTGMVRRVLDKSDGSHLFQPIQLNTAGASGALADATVSLWKCGHKVQFWPFHRSQRSEYKSINLPPYQFEKTRHWLDWIDTVEVPKPAEPATVESEPTLLSFVKFRDQRQVEAEFRVDPRSEAYKLYVQGHAVLAEPLCPAPLYIELVSQAAMVLKSESASTSLLPAVEGLDIKSPLGKSTDRTITILMKRVDGSTSTWAFELTSQVRGPDGKETGSPVSHATGAVTLQSEQPGLLRDFSRYERLIGYQRFDQLKNDPDSEAIKGSMVYKVFAKVVHYADFYKGVREVYAKDREVAGHVMLPPHNESALRDTMTEPLAIDNFVQVAGLHVNSLNECGDNEVYVCTKVDRIQPSPKFQQSGSDHRSWVVYSNFTPTGEKELVNDIFVFDATTKSMVLMVLGAHFSKVMISSLTRVLSRANTTRPDTTGPTKKALASVMPVRVMPDNDPVLMAATSSMENKKTAEKATLELDTDLRRLLSKVTDVPMEDFKDDATLEDLGVDSLMINEVQSEVCKHFQIDIPASDFENLSDVKSLRGYLVSRGCGGVSPLNSTSSSSTNLSDIAGSPAGTTATSVSNVPVAQGNLMVELAKLVAMHLETTATITRETNLANEGLDSLLCIELASDIKTSFGAEIDMAQLDGDSTFGDLLDMVMAQVKPATSVPAISVAPAAAAPMTAASNAPSTISQPASLDGVQHAFESIRYNYDVFTKQTGFADFWARVYPAQARLVLAYTVEAFDKLGCQISALKPGERLPTVSFLPKHAMLVAQLYNILKEGSLVKGDGANMVRTDTPVDNTSSDVLFRNILQDFPLHASEHKLLHITGWKLAECLRGAADPLQLLFRSKENKELLEEVYTNGPMYEAITKLLASFLEKAYACRQGGGIINILELGGGTGGTTKYIVEFLTRQGIPFTYTFTDLAGSLVTAAKKKFARYPNMQFQVLDIEKTPAENMLGRYHTIISTNCIHATRNLVVSTTNIRKMLRPDGFVSLVEFTRNMFWFDLVFGLLEGWWLFEDGRPHVLADELFWDKSMRTAGFKHITWTDGSSEEARTLRIITGFPSPPESDQLIPQKQTRKSGIPMETVMWKQAGNTPLFADIYHPSEVTSEKRPVALMIHSGGNCLFTRKEVNRKQTKLLLENGFLPVSVDYRLCPEMNVREGPMTDVCDALRWARYQLPMMRLNCAGLKVDGDRVVVVGWSTGGTLAMTLAFTALQQGLKPPEAILAFYCPTNWADDWWKKPIFPRVSATYEEGYDLLEGVEEEPIAGYFPPSNKGVLSMQMDLSDPRWRIILHMNWKAQMLPILINGLPSKKKLELTGKDAKEYYTMKMPSSEEIASINPYDQILRDNYRTPTYLIHGTDDDLIPWQQSKLVHDALVKKGVNAGISILEGGKHYFDTFTNDGLEGGWEAIKEGFEFLFSHV